MLLSFVTWACVSHADGPCWANETAEVASHASGTYDMRATVGIKGDGLVSAIGAGDVATSATYATTSVNLREDHRSQSRLVGVTNEGSSSPTSWSTRVSPRENIHSCKPVIKSSMMRQPYCMTAVQTFTFTQQAVLRFFVDVYGRFGSKECYSISRVCKIILVFESQSCVWIAAGSRR